jgi:hypothetical protein
LVVFIRDFRNPWWSLDGQRLPPAAGDERRNRRDVDEAPRTARRRKLGHSLTDDIVAACDRKVTIPMQQGVDSLNVAVAAGIFLYSVLGYVLNQ